ncbi:tetratricopeptide repeat protein [Siccirubricoccus deserti]|nr:tetratricopeptide repeat protein [Siccirubricoccus deserti]
MPDIGQSCTLWDAGGKEMNDRKRVAGLIRDHIARERLSREQFAFRTKLGKSTVDKLLVGLFSDRTLAIVEAQTGLSLRSASVRHEGASPESVTAPPDMPSIAVLPFANMGSDPAQDFLADGITEDLTTELSRLRWLLVIARNSTFAYKGRAVDVRQVARELGVRYVLEGSVRTAAGRIRVTAQLVEADAARHIWAERYDRDLGDIFAVQDEITRSAVAAIEPHLYAEEGARAARRAPESIDAWGLVVRALGLLHQVGRQQNEEARALLARAIGIEPGYARAHAVLGWAVWWAAQCQWCLDRDAGFTQAARHAEEAVALGPAEPWARMTLGLCLSERRRHERALVEARAAIELNPSFALGRATYGWVLLAAGRSEEAIAETGAALRMSPIDSFSGLYTSFHGLALLGARRFTEALPFLRASVAAFAENPGHLHTLISCCGHLGLTEEAADFIAARNRIAPPLRLGALRQRMAGFAHGSVFVEGLAKAGVPD